MVVSEIMYRPSNGGDYEFLELLNNGPDLVDLSDYQIAGAVQYSFTNSWPLAAGARVVIAGDRDVFVMRYGEPAFLAPGDFLGRLANEGELIQVMDSVGNLLDQVHYFPDAPWPPGANGFDFSLVRLNPTGESSDPTNWGVSAEPYGSPGVAGQAQPQDVLINEILAASEAPYEDAVELINVTTNPVDISGWTLSNVAFALDRYRIPTRPPIPPGGFAVFYESDFNDPSNPTNTAFSLGLRGAVYLSEVDAFGQPARIIDFAAFEPVPFNQSEGRYPDGQRGIKRLQQPTFGTNNPADLADFRTGAGAPNLPPAVGPVVITEIMYHPEDGIGVEYIELMNISDQAVELFHDHPQLGGPWNLTGGILYSFPTNTVLAPQEIILVSSTNRTATTNAYALPPGLRIFGPWLGNLSNDGEAVRLDAYAVNDNVTLTPYLLDGLTYNDQLPWPLSADGFGSSLERITAAGFGDVATNWQASALGGSPGLANLPQPPAGSLILSEIMAHNFRGLADEDGAYSDWIEVQNLTGDDVQLDGWFLTDDTLDLHKWRFPDVTLPANGFVLIFASGKDRTTVPGPLHANFQLSNNGEFLALIRPDGVSIEHAFTPAYPAQYPDIAYGGPNTNLFYETPTPGAANGIGSPTTAGAPLFSHPGGVYTNDFTLILSSPFPDVVIRYTTDGSDPSPSSSVFNGGIAISGKVEIRARAYRLGATPGPVSGKVYRDSFLGLNEFMAQNTTIFAEMLDFGDYVDWLELYNADTNSASLGGYFLTDNLDDPFKWEIPASLTIAANDTVIIMADGEDQEPGVDLTRDWWPANPFTTSWYHTNFRLSADGEELALFSPHGTLIDHVRYGMQTRDVSYGRLAGAGAWRYFGEPTPDALNLNEGLDTNCFYTADSELSLEGGFFSSPQSVVLTHPSPTVELFYTLDGSNPDRTATPYTGAIPLSVNTALRVRAFESGLLPSAIQTETYFFGEASDTLPTLSFTADPDLLYDPVSGIVENKLKRREVPAHVTYYDEHGQRVFSENLGVRLNGLNIFRHAQKPFSFFFRGRYGSDGVTAQLFAGNPSGFYDRFVLRNGGDDWESGLMRDALCQELVRETTELLIQEWTPVRVFHNGAYYGMMFLRDKSDEAMLINNYGIDPAGTDYIETDRTPGSSGLNAAAGDTDEFLRFLTWVPVSDYTKPATMERLRKEIDVENMHDFAIAQLYTANTSWPGNRSYWRMRQPDGKWRIVLLDMDRGMKLGFLNFNSVNNLTSSFGPWRKGLVDADYKNHFLQRCAAQLNTTYHPDRVIGIIDDMAARMDPEMPRQITRWAGDGGITTYNAWLNAVESLRSYARQRPAIVRQQLKNSFGLAGGVDVVFEQSGAGQGTILSDFTVMDNPGATNEYFSNVPMQLKAVPDIGSTFARWEISQNGVVSTNLNPELTYPPTNSTTVRAIFETDSVQTIGGSLSGDTTLGAVDSPWYATGDIIIPSNTTLLVEAGVTLFLPENASIYVYGKLEVNGTLAEPAAFLLNTNATARAPVFRDVDAVPVVLLKQRWGGIAVDRATAPTELNHLQIRDASGAADKTRFKAAISGWHSDLRMDGLDIERVDFPIFLQHGNQQELLNSRIHTEVVSDLINVKYANTALVQGNDFRGNLAPDTDAIDFDQLGSGGEIRDNIIHDFLGANSDAIDVGEGATNILVISNLIYNCTDKGVSVGQASEVVIRNNLIIGCAQGVGIKDTGSFALIDGNTLFGNGYGVAVVEKNKGAGGGSAELRNNIISGSLTNGVFVDALSSATYAYNLVDDDLLTGSGNWMGNPLFTSTASTNFTIQLGSLAVDHGDPALPVDPDGTRADIGAFPLDQNGPLLVITEIHYHPAVGLSNEYEFIEILNAGQQDLDLTDYSIGGLAYSFPSNTLISAGELILVAADRTRHANVGVRVFEWTSGSLNNAGESIRILDAASNRLDRVRYEALPPWPESANGQGPSLVLMHPFLDNDSATNWIPSDVTGGTPGALSYTMWVNPASISVEPNPFEVDLPTIIGLNYQLEFAADLNQNTWQVVSTAMGTGGTIRLNHIGGTTEPEGFYRISAYY
ncbi:MAG: hypothetical protein ACI9TH_000050 [Kiritimatiellia bacterium]